MADIKKNRPGPDTVAARLRRTEPVIADEAFVAAVMTRLPASRTLPAWLKNVILLIATALGSAIVAWHVPVTILPALLNTAVADWPEVLGSSIVLIYAAAFAALWTTARR